ncbi:cytochrome-c oxidase, cbb3-type subunit III [Luteimonas yindakuii]|uniref:Cbb3-type cytochrome c oxidase subunit n=1 Tax=Luteimonas yindakuii TaxID=2565782 RepID=A0A4Z1R4Z5_9GAMM|nr:cytochrome-c oxidase, cbb3-type subunit III [Luteimonas yindakuii]QCO68321.1 cytochrome-c oxidase, cbb3-type subunit III [Luteimonas yindakuii]TKS54724.1 cytochrome-c oxidase, cbb3-type subunit III [Luteimonas yindakuii]
MSNGWSWYVIVLVALNIAGCAWLLWWTARRRPGDPAPTDTSHVWDGDITEYNKPLPRWWINMFYLTIVFSIGYLFWYGGWGTFPGYSGWSSQGEHDEQLARNATRIEETFAMYAGRALPELAADPAALAIGRSVFTNTCATCHGSTGRGAVGYPDLADGSWQWGGEPEQILATILDGREGVMPPWGQVLTGMGGDTAMTAIVAYTRSLSRPANRNDYFAARGKQLYDGVCVACHGVDGTGNAALGAPDLTDDNWLYGGSPQAVHESIANGRHGVMPAHRDLLGETRARLVAAYVWSLSNPPATAAASAGAQ